MSSIDELTAEAMALRAEVARLTAEYDNMREVAKKHRDAECTLTAEVAKLRGELAANEAGLLARFLAWRGIEYGNEACPTCGGAGSRSYPSSAGWMGGAGGQAITSGVCDKCWGSGDASRPWLNLRTLAVSRTRDAQPVPVTMAGIEFESIDDAHVPVPADTVVCRYCDAPPGEPCKGESGGVAYRPHHARMVLARATSLRLTAEAKAKPTEGSRTRDAATPGEHPIANLLRAQREAATPGFDARAVACGINQALEQGRCEGADDDICACVLLIQEEVQRAFDAGRRDSGGEARAAAFREVLATLERCGAHADIVDAVAQRALGGCMLDRGECSTPDKCEREKRCALLAPPATREAALPTKETES